MIWLRHPRHPREPGSLQFLLILLVLGQLVIILRSIDRVLLLLLRVFLEARFIVWRHHLHLHLLLELGLLLGHISCCSLLILRVLGVICCNLLILNILLGYRLGHLLMLFGVFDILPLVCSFLAHSFLLLYYVLIIKQKRTISITFPNCLLLIIIILFISIGQTFIAIDYVGVLFPHDGTLLMLLFGVGVIDGLLRRLLILCCGLLSLEIRLEDILTLPLIIDGLLA